MYLADRGLDAAGLDNPSLLSPADRGSLARIMGVEIRGAAYAIEPLASEDGAAYRLTGPRGQVYDVCDHQHGAVCDCPDFTFKRAGLDSKGCKHVAGLVAAGLIANAPAPLISNEPGVEAPAPVVPTYSADADVEAAVGAGAACLFPASLNYRTNMAMLADMADRSAAVRAELDALRSAPLDPVVPAEARHEAEPEPAGDGASTAESWPAWTDRDHWSVSADPADDDDAAGEYEAWSEGLPYAPTDEDYAWLAAESGATDALAAGLVPADVKPVKVSPARRRVMNFGDEDMAIVGAV